MPETQRRTHITDVRTVAVPVTDQDRAVHFFVDQLGFEKRMDAPFGPGQRWIEVGPPGSSVNVGLVPARPGQPTGIDTGIRFTSDDVEADHADLIARGIDADPEVISTPVLMFAFRDLDRNRFVIARGGAADPIRRNDGPCFDPYLRSRRYKHHLPSSTALTGRVGSPRSLSSRAIRRWQT